VRAEQMAVRLVARPDVDWEAMTEWVNVQGGAEWLDRMEEEVENDSTYPGQILVEAAGRRCYKSWSPGLNANVTRVRTDSDEYLRNIVSIGHGSVLEHAQYSFALEGVSRVVTHELVRHRVGVAISQESLRYVRLTDIPFRHPDWIADDEVLGPEADDLLARMENFQRLAAERGRLDDPDVDFHERKVKTSDMRRYAPIGLLTGMVWSANVRTLRQTIESRTDFGAEREIRELFDKVGRIMQDECPSLFGDFKFEYQDGNPIPAWVPARSKV
jgi:thymidylate synthase (FAD)